LHPTRRQLLIQSAADQVEGSGEKVEWEVKRANGLPLIGIRCNRYSPSIASPKQLLAKDLILFSVHPQTTFNAELIAQHSQLLYCKNVTLRNAC